MLMINHMKKTYIQKICVKTMKNMVKTVKNNVKTVKNKVKTVKNNVKNSEILNLKQIGYLKKKKKLTISYDMT